MTKWAEAIQNEAVQTFIREHIQTPAKELALKLSKKDLPKDFILSQINGIQKAKIKLPEWSKNEHIIYSSPRSMEQCSSEQTAKYKSTFIKGKNLLDLSCGFGVDAYFIGKNFEHIDLVEPQEELLEVVKHNFEVLGFNGKCTYHQETAESFVASNHQQWDVIYLDPSRRSDQGKTVFLNDYLPHPIELENSLLELATEIHIKVSPLLDIHKAIQDLKSIQKIRVISLYNDCKELILSLGKEKTEVQIECINIENGKIDLFDFPLKKEAEFSAVTALPEKYIYEPNSSILKAGAFNCITEKYAVKKLHQHSHLYTSENLIEDFPGRVFVLVESLPYKPKEIQAFIGKYGVSIAKRNFPDNVETIRKKLKLKDGNDYYLFATTLQNDEKRILICRKEEFFSAAFGMVLN